MQSHHAIKALEAYIQTISKKAKQDTRVYKGSEVGIDERIQSTLEQIELYKVGKGRLNF